jgi:hypothetical protein
VLPKSISASDVGQKFLSAGSGDFPVPGFRVKLSALIGEVGKLRNRQARKPALQFGQHALKVHPTVVYLCAADTVCFWDIKNNVKPSKNSRLSGIFELVCTMLGIGRAENRRFQPVAPPV